MTVTARPPEAIARRRRAGLIIAVTATVVFVLVAVGIGTVFLRPQLFMDVPVPTVATDVERLSVGDLVPTISGEDFDGRSVVIDEGEARVLLFAAHWCDHCKAELEMLAEARDSGTLDLDVSLVVISTRHIPGVRWPPADALDLEGGPDEFAGELRRYAALVNARGFAPPPDSPRSRSHAEDGSIHGLLQPLAERSGFPVVATYDELARRLGFVGVTALVEAVQRVDDRSTAL